LSKMAFSAGILRALKIRNFRGKKLIFPAFEL
jgi:hypothetical protein